MAKIHRYTKQTQMERLNFIVEEINAYAGGANKEFSILELGCGTGNISIPLGSLGFKVMAVDIDGPSISFAQTRSNFPNVKFAVENCTSPDIVKRIGTKFDCIVCSDVIEHVTAPDILLRSAKSLLSYGGILILTTCNGYDPYEIFIHTLRVTRFYNIAGRLKRAAFDSKVTQECNAASGSLNIGEGSPHVQYFTFNKLSNLIKDVGLFPTKIVNAGTSLSLGSFGPFQSDSLQRVDIRLGNHVPHWTSGGWYFVLSHKTRAS